MSKKTDRSKELFEQAKRMFVDGVASALHKSEHEAYPIYIDSGKGSRVYDVDGNEYIDYLGGYGPIILGYGSPALEKAIINQMRKGSLFAAPTESLNIVSEKITTIVPCAELITYQNTGTEAIMLAFRIARAFTGKDKIVKFEGHYHGWSDEEMISIETSSQKMMGPRNRPWKTFGSAGQPEKAAQDIIVLPWNDLNLVEKALNRHRHEIAAIITEPVMCNCDVVFPEENFLKGLREITAQNDVLLIFDEVITGFRLALGGAQEYYGVIPDLCTLGKAIAGGFPLSIVAGRREIMESGVHIRGTFNANPISVAACMATIKELESPGIYDQLNRLTEKLTTGILDIAKKENIALYCEHIGSIWQISFGIRERMKDYRDNFKVDKIKYSRFRKECFERGIRLHPSRGRQYVSTAHTEEDIDSTLVIIEEILKGMS
ncbi:MAG: glutamate-1-semialdehyde 2,1-aminomutase [Pseudomonadota bacterium]